MATLSFSTRPARIIFAYDHPGDSTVQMKNLDK
jgi:hypothetical protein